MDADTVDGRTRRQIAVDGYLFLLVVSRTPSGDVVAVGVKPIVENDDGRKPKLLGARRMNREEEK